MKVISCVKTLLFTGAIAVALTLGACKKEADTANPAAVLPQKLDTRIEMKSGEKTRTVQYQPGTNLKLFADVDFKLGETGEINYYRTGPGAGNVRDGKIYFPRKKDDASEPRLQRAFEMEVDGRTYRWHRQYWQDGARKHLGERVGDKYEASDFQPDGKTLIRHRLFGIDHRKWLILNEEEYWPNAAPKRIAVMNQDQSGTIEEFSEDRVLLSRSEMKAYGFELVTQLFNADGTLDRRITRDSEVLIERFESGRKVEELKFHYMFTGLTRTFYDADDKPVLRQYWNLQNGNAEKNAGKVSISDYALNYYQLFDREGRAYKQVTFWAPPMTPVTIAERTANTQPHSMVFFAPGALRVFRKDGTLEKIVYYNSANEKIGEKDFDADSAILAEPSNAAYTEPKPFDQPPPALPGAPPKGE